MTNEREAGENLSPTGILRKPQADPPSSAADGPQEAGEFTRLFQRVQPKADALPSDESGAAGDFTRVFSAGIQSEGAQRGFSSPGKSESAAAEGSVTQLFRVPAAPAPESEAAVPVASPGITRLIESLSVQDPSPAPAPVPPPLNKLESVEHTRPVATTASAPPAPASAPKIQPRPELPVKKTKLETMAPALLALNTVLLVAVLLLLLLLLLRPH